MRILEMIEHATSPDHDDGAFHENAYSLARSAKEQSKSRAGLMVEQA